LLAACAVTEPEPESKSVHYMECEDVGSDIKRCANDEIVCYITDTYLGRDMECSTDIMTE